LILLRNHPLAAAWAVNGLFLAFVAVVLGYQSYDYKKKEADRQRRSLDE
jgi:hypothetical protein